jgi:hypothetical protein
MQRWKLIDTALSLGQAEPAETYSTSEHLYTELSIPREVTGTLPRALRSRAGLDAEAVEDIGETGGRTPHDRDGGRDRSRSRRGRGSGTGGRGPGDHQEAGPSGHDDAAPRERKPRNRRRTRSGQEVPADGSAGGQAAAPDPSAGQPDAAEGSGASRTRTRRRRSRGGQSATASAASAASASHPVHDGPPTAIFNDGQSSAAS